MADPLLKHRFSVADFQRMAESGILSDVDRVELWDGQVVQMTPISPRHVACVNRVTRWLSGQLADRALLSVQNPVNLTSESQPQPDSTPLAPKEDDYSRELPTAAEVLLVAEVADTSLQYDREVKIPAYCRIRIPEVGWLIWSTMVSRSSQVPRVAVTST